jgi:6-pyruvoyltetrahydropterin/6-carboxytetrahydropterin synthase
VVNVAGVSDEGMVMDFSDISAVLMEHVHDVIDHAFVVFEGDQEGRAACQAMGEGHRTVVVPFIPTAENLAKWAFEAVQPHIQSRYGNRLNLVAMHCRETPKSIATWRPKS